MSDEEFVMWQNEPEPVIDEDVKEFYRIRDKKEKKIVKKPKNIEDENE